MRHLSMKRTGPSWATEHRHGAQHATSLSLKCLNCGGTTFCRGATHIAAHIIDKCTCESDAFTELKN